MRRSLVRAFISVALQKSSRADRRPFMTQCYHAAMRRLPLPLLLLVILLAAPVAFPFAMVSWIRDHRRMRAVAEQTPCQNCGATLGAASLQRADAKWSKLVAAKLKARPDIRLRMVRKLWAICAACGAEYDYDFGSRTFHRATELVQALGRDYWSHR